MAIDDQTPKLVSSSLKYVCVLLIGEQASETL